MSEFNDFQNYTINNNSSLNGDISLRQAKTFQTPLLGLLLAASVLAKSTQAKPYFLGYGQSPWYPIKSLYHNLPSVSQLWHPISGNVYPRYTQQSTSAPQILPPPLHQQQSVNIHETSPEKDFQETLETGSGEILLDNVDDASEIPVGEDPEISNDLQADSSDLNELSVENSTNSATTEENFLEDEDVQSTIKRDRRTTPGSIRRVGTRRPVNDYMDSKNRRRPTRRRTTTPIYDYNRRRKRPSKNRNKPSNRRPINKDSEFYDNSQYDDDYYEDYYANDVDIFARQGEFTTTTTTESTTSTTTGTPPPTVTPSPTTPNNTYGYTYGPPIQTGYGPPGQTGYGPPQTGYGPSNGNEYVSITYPPLTDPGRDVLAPLLDSLYNQYSKNSIIRRLQELLQPNNFYNTQQYDVNYPENF